MGKKNQIESELKTSEEQCGFTAETSVTDHLFAIRQFMAKWHGKGKELQLVFIDQEKVYDSIPISNGKCQRISANYKPGKTRIQIKNWSNKNEVENILRF